LALALAQLTGPGPGAWGAARAAVAALRKKAVLFMVDDIVYDQASDGISDLGKSIAGRRRE
jgi:shikimate 5-dehydrogenase